MKVLFPKYSESRVEIITDIYTFLDRNILFDIYHKASGQKLLRNLACIEETSYPSLSALTEHMIKKTLSIENVRRLNDIL